MTLDERRWQDRLEALTSKYGVPGATLAVSFGEDVADACSGVLNEATRVATTTDSVFQIGSITKVWTATLVMQLVDDGRLDLDEPLIKHLKGFRLGDQGVAEAVTARHLLAHSSGIDGDRFVETGRGDDALERYVEACSNLGQVHPLGATMSYCNSGYTILGRLIEVLRGKTWDEVVRERLSDPLGLKYAGTLPEEALLHRAAVGHVTPPGGTRRVTPRWGLFRSNGPPGAVHTTAREVLTFADLHLAGGTAADGTRLLSAASATEMLQPQVAVPNPYIYGSHWGLGWILMNWDGHPVFGHDGSTLGQQAYLRIVPEVGIRLCLLTNGGSSQGLFRDLFNELLAELAGIEMLAPLEPATTPTIDLRRYVGRYARENFQMTLEPDGSALRATVEKSGIFADTVGDHQPPAMQVLPVREDVCVGRSPGDPSWTPIVFFRLPNGAEYVHYGVRATPRVD